MVTGECLICGDWAGYDTREEFFQHLEDCRIANPEKYEAIPVDKEHR